MVELRVDCASVAAGAVSERCRQRGLSQRPPQAWFSPWLLPEPRCPVGAAAWLQSCLSFISLWFLFPSFSRLCSQARRPPAPPRFPHFFLPRLLSPLFSG